MLKSARTTQVSPLRQFLLANLIFCLLIGGGVPGAGVAAQADDEAALRNLFAKLIAAKDERERQALLFETTTVVVSPKLQKALERRARELMQQGEYPHSRAINEAAHAVAERLGDDKAIVAALVVSGNTYFLEGEYDRASDLYRRSLKLAEQSADESGSANARNSLGVVHYQRGEYDEALKHLRESLALRLKLNDRDGTADAYVNIGNVHYDRGDYVEAQKLYEQSLTLREELNDRADVAIALGNIGNVHQMQGDYATALDFQRRSLAIREELNDRAGVATTHGNIGAVYAAQGDHLRALAQHQRSLRIAEEINGKVAVADALNNIGSLYLRQDDYPQALDHYLRGLKLAEEVGDRASVAYALANVGEVYAAQGDRERAAVYYRRSLELSERLDYKVGVLAAQGALGRSSAAAGDYAKALEWHDKNLALAAALGDQEAVTFALIGAADVHRHSNDHRRALECAERAVDLARRTANLENRWRALELAGESHRALGRIDQARRAFEESIATIEQMREQVAGAEGERQRFFEKRVSPYYDMVGLLLERGEERAALAFAERAKGRVLLDVLHSGRLDVTKSMTAEELTRERRLRARLVSLNAQIGRESSAEEVDPARRRDLEGQLRRARLEHEAFQTALYAAHPALKSRRGRAGAFSLPQSRELLRGGRTALVEYALSDDKAYLFVITENAAGSARRTNEAGDATLKVYTLPASSEELGRKAAAFRRTLADHGLDYEAAARELYDLLLKPAEEQLRGVETLCVVPDGALWETPFQALRSPSNRFLIEDYAVHYAPSLGVLREMQGSKVRATPPSELLAIGAPPARGQAIAAAAAAAKSTIGRVESRARRSDLPEAEREVKSLWRLYGPKRSAVYVGADARESTFKADASRYRVLHLATHGVFDDRHPMYSHLILAESGDGEDGLLEAWEVARLDLRADLAVLSACQTARGRAGSGEGLIGMTWALFVAGCPSTVASQWKVEATSTTEFTLALHRNLAGERGVTAAPKTQAKAEALRRAALQLLGRDEYRHPFYWAGFALVGDAG